MRSVLRSHAVAQAWFDTLADQHRLLARELESALLAAVPALTPAVKWGNLVFMHRGTNALAIVAHQRHVNLQIFNGALFGSRFRSLGALARTCVTCDAASGSRWMQGLLASWRSPVSRRCRRGQRLVKVDFRRPAQPRSRPGLDAASPIRPQSISAQAPGSGTEAMKPWVLRSSVA